jgi:hypothetical protein
MCQRIVLLANPEPSFFSNALRSLSDQSGFMPPQARPAAPVENDPMRSSVLRLPISLCCTIALTMW